MGENTGNLNGFNEGDDNAYLGYLLDEPVDDNGNITVSVDDNGNITVSGGGGSLGNTDQNSGNTAVVVPGSNPINANYDPANQNFNAIGNTAAVASEHYGNYDPANQNFNAIGNTAQNFGNTAAGDPVSNSINANYDPATQIFNAFGNTATVSNELYGAGLGNTTQNLGGFGNTVQNSNSGNQIVNSFGGVGFGNTTQNLGGSFNTIQNSNSGNHIVNAFGPIPPPIPPPSNQIVNAPIPPPRNQIANARGPIPPYIPPLRRQGKLEYSVCPEDALLVPPYHLLLPDGLQPLYPGFRLCFNHWIAKDNKRRKRNFIPPLVPLPPPAPPKPTNLVLAPNERYLTPGWGFIEKKDERKYTLLPPYCSYYDPMTHYCVPDYFDIVIPNRMAGGPSHGPSAHVASVSGQPSGGSGQASGGSGQASGGSGQASGGSGQASGGSGQASGGSGQALGVTGQVSGFTAPPADGSAPPADGSAPPHG